MTQDRFFDKIESHYKSQLPFVIYGKPDDAVVKAMLQKDDEVCDTEDFVESGFVFSPFDIEKNTILIPSRKATSIVCTDAIRGKEKVDVSGVSKNESSTKDSLEKTKSLHMDVVGSAVKAIKEEEEFEKVVISRTETIVGSETSPIRLFKKLLQTYKSAFVYCWYHPKIGLWLGATPETLLLIQGRQLSTMALAGTQQYKGIDEVVWQEKEKTEQQLVTDFIIGNLESSLEGLSIGSPKTIKAGSLLHLKTELKGRLPANIQNIKSVVMALHPTPAVCGMPRERAKQFIMDHENYDREFYTGFLGELNFKEKTVRNTNRRNVENNVYGAVRTVTNLFVNLRCMQCKGDEIVLYVGGGITKDSIPENEWEETVNKTSTIKNIL